MRIHRALHQIVMRFSGMEEAEGMELYGEASTSYKEVLDSAKAKTRENDAIRAENLVGAGRPNFKPRPEVKLKKTEEAILWAEKWPSRYLVAILYILSVPKIKEYYEGGPEGEDEMGQMDPMEMMRFMSMYSKFQNFQKK